MNVEPDLTRYSRQILFGPIGAEGQRRLGQAHATLIGCGALGSVLASTLIRAGVGHLRIVDRDFLELDNLQRQILFDEQDLADNLPKAEAAARKLRRINSQVEVEPAVADFNPSNAEWLCRDAGVLLDGTDNLETRYLINDVAVKHGIPWVYGACIAAEGRVLPILPRETPCLRCLWEEPLPPGALPTCETVGVLGPVVNIVASLQAVEALKILTGRRDDLNPKLVTIDAWTGRIRQIEVGAAMVGGQCPCCKLGRFDFLAGGKVSATTALCGRDAVQVLPPPGQRVDFAQLAARLAGLGDVRYNAYLLRLRRGDYEIVLFPDGRAIIRGTSDPAVARSIFSKYVGL